MPLQIIPVLPYAIVAFRPRLLVAQHKLDLNLDSKVTQVPIHARANAALTGDYAIAAVYAPRPAR